MTRSSFAQHRYVYGETDIILTPNVPVTKGVIFCHGSGDTAKDSALDQFGMMDALAQNAVVIAADLGGETWGNDVGISRVQSAIDYIKTNYGVTGKVALVGGSMGNTTALSYTRANPQNVACVAGVIPLTDIQDLGTRFGFAAMNVAYSGGYNDATHGPTHNPIRFAASLPPDLPIKLWSDVADTIILPSVTQAFVAARPTTEIAYLPGYGHTDAALTVATPDVVKFVRKYL